MQGPSALNNGTKVGKDETKVLASVVSLKYLTGAADAIALLLYNLERRNY